MEVIPLLVSALLAAVMAPPALRAFERAGWQRPNWRGREVAFPLGAVAVAAAVVSLAPLALFDELAGAQLLRQAPGEAPGGGDHAVSGLSDDVLGALPLFLGVALLGLLDDTLGAEPRGWRGHGAAILRGGFSTGALKAAGTLALALAVLAGRGLGAGEYLLAVLVVVLATNFFNLLDLRPGRSVKAFALLGGALLAAAGESGALRAVGAPAGALLVLGAYDLRERGMLGDTGSNLLGALAGVWLVLALDTGGQAVAAAALAVLTIFGEFRSISAAIERLPPLRALDSIGRRT